MRRVWGVLMAGALVFTAACGSNSGDDGAAGTGAKSKSQQKTPLDAVLASSTKTMEAKSSKAALMLLARGVQGVPGMPGGSIAITGEGAYDYAGRRGAFTMNIPPLGGMQLGRIEAVSTGSVLYQKFPPQVASALGAKPWVKVDLDQLGQAVGVDFNVMFQASFGDATQALQFLRGSGADMVKVGRDQVRGEAVTHYRGTVDVDKAAAAASPEQQQTYQKLGQLFAQPLPVEVWIDGEERLRKMTYSVDLAALTLPPQATAGQNPTGTCSFTVELFDFGAPVSVTVPAAEQVTDFAQLFAAAGGRR